MDLHLKDKVALVTGSGSQIGYGRNIAITLAKEGCHIIAADINLEGARKTAAEIEASGNKALAVMVDVTDRMSVDEMVKKAIDTFGRIEILVNNAGASSRNKPFVETTKNDWDIDINVNLIGQMNVAQAVLPSMISRKYGRIINFSGGQGIANISVYGAAKAGIVAFTHALAAEVAPFGVIVNGMAPGLGETGLTVETPDDFKEGYKRASMLKRLCAPEDVGPAIAFLASDVCSYMTGQFFPLKTL
ncbi:MAG: SDR family oxidoreductase [Deltaproteobacteria bacterium]|nr:SDR family oxidoreductase [Deltaproteobacteria bacterium]